MILSIPNQIKGMNKDEKSVLDKIKSIYSIDEGLSYLYLEPKIGNLYPDFILIDPKRGVSIIEVKGWSLDYINKINEKEVTTSDGKQLENPAYKARRYYNMAKRIFSSSLFLSKGNLELNFQLSSVVILTNIKRSEVVEKDILKLLDHYPAEVIFQEDFKNLDYSKIFPRGIEAIDKSLIDEIRGTIFPEIQIPTQKEDNQTSKNNRILSLDIAQEEFAKKIPNGHYMITGVPGSGKTVILVSRAIYLAKMYPEYRILIVTYNKTLSTKMENRIEIIKKKLEYQDIFLNNIEIKTFHQIANFYGSSYIHKYKNEGNFWDEILPNDAIKNATPKYDIILVDEYQDFKKNWFELLIKLLKKFYNDKNESYVNLFLAGDRLQSIYNPREINWKQDIGLDMRGRSRLLQKSYRTTKEHLKLGIEILKSDKSYEKEIEKFYQGENRLNSENSSKDSIELLETEYRGIVHKINELLRDNYNYGDLLILAPTKRSIQSIYNFLPYEIAMNTILSKNLNDDKKMIISTYHSSKGIECKVVIATSVDRIDDPKLLYVASTRASEKLILHCWNFQNSDLSRLIYQKVNGESI